MQLGMIGAGRMGSNMVLRLLESGHQCVVHDPRAPLDALSAQGAQAARSAEDLVQRLAPPRAVWLMLPAGAVDAEIAALAPLLGRGDILVDGGNSHFSDDIRRARELAAHGIHYVDVGTSGGIAGRERGYCLMIGGEKEAVERLAPVFASLAPGIASATRTPGRESGGTAESGYLHCGPHGAGHFVKMVHNGIEYGLMAAYAEGMNILRHANAGKVTPTSHDAETAPLRNPELYQYDFQLADIAELWRRGSVISSWLLDLTARGLLRDPELGTYAGRVSDSGEGRWTLNAALDEGVPAAVLSAALFERFASRGNADFANRLLSAMRHAFGGHTEQK
jgi:6-phosphogluconate dehydrogenase